MSRLVFVIPFLAFALQVSQGQISSHGAPASTTTTSTSPAANGHQHGATASVFTPSTGVHQPLRPGVRVHGPVRRFGNQRIRQQVFVPIPLFYPSYGYGYGDSAYPSTADPSVADTQAQADPTQASPTQANPAQTNAAQPSQGATDQNEDQLRAAYLQGAHDAMTRQDQGDSRYGEHYMDSRERSQQQPAADQKSPDNTKAEFSMIPPEDKSPATVFIFKDGHQLETKNYAIMGGTLFDFSGKLVKKIQLDDLDPTATVKANDDRGVQVKLP
jgi:hypothetical protein